MGLELSPLIDVNDITYHLFLWQVNNICQTNKTTAQSHHLGSDNRGLGVVFTGEYIALLRIVWKVFTS